ncbi:ParB N-terminal domain-containing protein [Halomonas sp. H2]|uniref:ParB N-terminal domain-containing protein n=3 Tax=unclassified Halomonas TaxID=2609666 RepID=UPI003CF35472
MTQSTARSLDKLHRGKFTNLRKSNQFSALVEDINEQPGFNPRNYELPRLQEHIRSLADAYKRGQFVDPIVVQVVDGEIYVRDGHCRRRAMLLAQEEGTDLGLVPMVEFRGDEIEADALILTSQSGKKLSAVEVASMYNRMTLGGMF